MKFLALFNNEASAIAGFVGKTKYTNSENAKNILNFNFENVRSRNSRNCTTIRNLGSN